MCADTTVELTLTIKRPKATIDGLVALDELLATEGDGRGVVHVARRGDLDFIFRWIGAARIPVALYDECMSPRDRDESRRRFEAGDVRIMVAASELEFGVESPDVQFAAFCVPEADLANAIAQATRSRCSRCFVLLDSAER